MPAQQRPSRPLPNLNDERGIALIAVLWLVAWLTMIATSAVMISMTRLKLARAVEHRAQIELAADGAIRVAIAQLASPGSRAEPFGAAPSEFLILGRPVSVRVSPESGRLNVNYGDPLLLEALFLSIGWSRDEARDLVARIEDWKDPDDLLRDGGAEWRQYRLAGLPYRPRNGLFESVGELRQVLGAESLPPELLESVTVYGQHRTVDAHAAVAGAESALEWADRLQLGGHRWLSSAGTAGGDDAARNRANFTIGDVLRIQACVDAGEDSLCRIAVVRLTGNSRNPLQVFDWR